MSYLVYQKNNPVGIFDDIELCKDYIKSIEENNWATNFRVVKYKKNSCLKLFDKKISFLNKSDTNKTNDESMIVGDSKGISSNDCELFADLFSINFSFLKLSLSFKILVK